MTTLIYLVIKEKFEKMWVIGPYFVWWRLVRHHFGWVGVDGALFWVGGGGWYITLGGWHSVHPPPRSAGRVEPPTKFSKRGCLIES